MSNSPKKVRIYVADKDKTPASGSKPIEKNIDDLSKPIEVDIWADWVPDAKPKTKVANVSFTYDGKPPDPSENEEPRAEAGADQIVKPKSKVVLDGSKSFDPDGDKLTYKWENESATGNTIQIIDSDKPVASFTAPDIGTPPDPSKPLAVLLANPNATMGAQVIMDASLSSNYDTLDLKQTIGENQDVKKEGTLYKFTAKDTGSSQQSYQVAFQLTAKKGTSESTAQVAIQISKTTPPLEGKVLWDSDVHLKTGKDFKITDSYGDTKPDGKGVYMAASGSPYCEVKANGEFHIGGSKGHGRMYIEALNFNSFMEGEIMFLDSNIDNSTQRLRSRHQAGGACENRFGGYGQTFERGVVEHQTESCHNNHENGNSKSLSTKIENGKWIKFRYSVFNSPDNKSVNQVSEYDYLDGKGYQRLLATKQTNPKPYYVDKATFMKHSYAWLRINNEKPGKVAYRHVKIVEIPDDKLDRLAKSVPDKLKLRAPNDTKLTFKLTVTDTKGKSATDKVDILVTNSVPNPPDPIPTGDTTRFLMVADNDTTPDAADVYDAMSKIEKVNQYCVVGDLPYAGNGKTWNSQHRAKWKDNSLWRVSKGNHDCSASEKDQTQWDLEVYFTRYHKKWWNEPDDKKYMDNIRANLWLEYEQVNNVFVINMDSEDMDIPFRKDQFKWVTEEALPKAKELKAAGKINWIMVWIHRPWFTLKSSHDPNVSVRFLYAQAFIDAGVDLIIHGHNHNTQLWYPMIPNTSDANGEGTQLFEYAQDGKTFDFSKKHGWLTVVTGHGGHEWNEIKDSPAGKKNVMFYADGKTNSKKFGFTQLDFTGKKLTVKSIDTDLKVLYEYNVVK